MGFALWRIDTCDVPILVNTETGEKAFTRPSAIYSTPEEAHAENQFKNAQIKGPLEEEFGPLVKPINIVELGKRFFLLDQDEKLTEVTKDQASQLVTSKYLDWTRNDKGTLDYVLVGFTEEEKLRAAEIIKHEVIIKDDGGVIVKQPVVVDDEAVIKGA